VSHYTSVTTKIRNQGALLTALEDMGYKKAKGDTMPVQLKIRITTTGEISFDVSGVEGPTCEQLTDALVRASGEVKSKEYKEEYTLVQPDYLENHEG
jgi:hypothetical protein